MPTWLPSKSWKSKPPKRLSVSAQIAKRKSKKVKVVKQGSLSRAVAQSTCVRKPWATGAEPKGDDAVNRAGGPQGRGRYASRASDPDALDSDRLGSKS
jgi:hypothetical protein